MANKRSVACPDWALVCRPCWKIREEWPLRHPHPDDHGLVISRVRTTCQLSRADRSGSRQRICQIRKAARHRPRHIADCLLVGGQVVKVEDGIPFVPWQGFQPTTRQGREDMPDHSAASCQHFGLTRSKAGTLFFVRNCRPCETGDGGRRGLPGPRAPDLHRAEYDLVPCCYSRDLGRAIGEWIKGRIIGDQPRPDVQLDRQALVASGRTGLAAMEPFTAPLKSQAEMLHPGPMKVLKAVGAAVRRRCGSVQAWRPWPRGLRGGRAH